MNTATNIIKSIAITIHPPVVKITTTDGAMPMIIPVKVTSPALVLL